MITFEASGDYEVTEKWLKRMASQDIFATLSRYGEIGCQVLAAATPKDTGETSRSWYYDIEMNKGYYSIGWGNSHMGGTTPIAVLLQFGHGTGTGGYVSGRDYINPALRPVFDRMAADAWREVMA
jgi:hypothetical protein